MKKRRKAAKPSEQASASVVEVAPATVTDAAPQVKKVKLKKKAAKKNQEGAPKKALEEKGSLLEDVELPSTGRLPRRNDFTPREGPYTYQPDPDDHCETDIRAYKHLRPVLLQLERSLYGKNQGELRLWDPYYCDGAMKRNLASIGFPKAHNENEDFYEVLRSGKLPPHDVLVTSPPYSQDHIEKCMRHCAASGKPWCVLNPNWVYGKDFYQEVLKTPSVASSPPVYIAPVGMPYHYWFPEGSHTPSHVGEDGKTTPYATSWYVFIPGSVGGGRLLDNLMADQHKMREWVMAKTVKGLKWLKQKAEQRSGKGKGKGQGKGQGKGKADRREIGGAKDIDVAERKKVVEGDDKPKAKPKAGGLETVPAGTGVIGFGAPPLSHSRKKRKVGQESGGEAPKKKKKGKKVVT